MAATLRLKNASYDLALHDTDVYGVREGGLGIGRLNDVYTAPYHLGFEPLIDRHVGNRAVTLAMHVRGSSPDDLLTNYRQLASVLRDATLYSRSQGDEGDQAYLYWKGDSWTNGLYFDVLGASYPDVGVLRRQMQRTSGPVAVDVPVTLMCKPWGRPEGLTSVTSGTLNNGGGTGATSTTYLQAATAFDEPAPARVTVQSSAAPRQFVIAGKFKHDPTNFDPLLHADTGLSPYTNYTVTNVHPPGWTFSAAVVAGASQGLVSRYDVSAPTVLSNSNLLTWAINNNLHAYRGRYRVYCRVDTLTYKSAVSVNAKLRLRWGGDGTKRTNDTCDLGSANLSDFLADLGIINIPEVATPNALARENFGMTLDLTCTPGASGATIDIDCLYLVPVDELYARVDLEDAVGGASDQLVLDFLAQREGVALLDSTGLVQVDDLVPYGVSRMVIPPNSEIRWLVLVGYDVTATVATNGIRTHTIANTYTIKVEHHKLYHHGYA